jgi:hypothetical protein
MFIVHNSIDHRVPRLDPLVNRRNMQRAVGNQTGCFKMTALTLVHVVLSLAGIGSGFIVVFGLIAGKRLDGLTALFLASTVATSLTGFLFPFHKLLPSHVVGIVSLVVLGIAILARYARHLTGAWRWIYAVNVVIGLYLNVFVLVAQVFQKVPALKAMAPTQSEAPFVVAQVVVMALFVVLGILAVKRFHHRTGRGAVAFC